MAMAALIFLLLRGGTPSKVPFAPGVISTAAGADAPTFTPDGNLVVYDSPPTIKKSTLMIARRIGGRWRTPEVAPFSGRWYDQDPAMAPDGSYLIFVSNRPARLGGRPLGATGGNLWRVERHGDGWGEPVRLPEIVNSSARIYAPSVAADGSIFYPSGGNVYVCAKVDGKYRAARKVVIPGAMQLGDAEIAPDGSFLVFEAVKGKAGEFYLSRWTGKGWGPPHDLHVADDGSVNWDPHLGPGGRRLYFSSQRNGVTGIWSIALAPWLRQQKD